MTNAAFLQQYRNAQLEWHTLQRELDRLNTAGRPSAGHGCVTELLRTTNDHTAALMQQLDGLEAMVEAARLRCEGMAERFARLQAACGDFRSQFILAQYYQRGCTDGQIAVTLRLTPRHVNRLRHALLDRLADA